MKLMDENYQWMQGELFELSEIECDEEYKVISR